MGGEADYAHMKHVNQEQSAISLAQEGSSKNIDDDDLTTMITADSPARESPV